MNRLEFIPRHPQRLAAAGVLLSTMMLFSACSGPQATDRRADEQLQPAAQPEQTEPEAESGDKAMPALKSLLETFAADTGREWQRYDTVPGVTWRDEAPVPREGAREAGAAHKRGGNILLAGFSMVDVPNGKTGAEAGSRQDNEGSSGITLFGSSDRVESVAIMKFYPSRDYAGILKNQLGSDAAIELAANACGEPGLEDPEAREFYRIATPAMAPVYVEIFVDAEGGKYSPGSTTFVFYRDEPKDKIESLGCKVVGKN